MKKTYEKKLFNFWNGDTPSGSIISANSPSFTGVQLEAQPLYTDTIDLSEGGQSSPDILLLTITYAGLLGGASGMVLQVRAGTPKDPSDDLLQSGGENALKVMITNGSITNIGVGTIGTDTAGTLDYIIGIGTVSPLLMLVPRVRLRFDRATAGALTAGTFTIVLTGYQL